MRMTAVAASLAMLIAVAGVPGSASARDWKDLQKDYRKFVEKQQKAERKYWEDRRKAERDYRKDLRKFEERRARDFRRGRGVYHFGYNPYQSYYSVPYYGYPPPGYYGPPMNRW